MKIDDHRWALAPILIGRNSEEYLTVECNISTNTVIWARNYIRLSINIQSTHKSMWGHRRSKRPNPLECRNV